MQTIDIKQIEKSVDAITQLIHNIREKIHVSHSIERTIKKSNNPESIKYSKDLANCEEYIAVNYSFLKLEARKFNELLNPKQE